MCPQDTEVPVAIQRSHTVHLWLLVSGYILTRFSSAMSLINTKNGAVLAAYKC